MKRCDIIGVRVIGSILMGISALALLKILVSDEKPMTFKAHEVSSIQGVVLCAFLFTFGLVFFLQTCQFRKKATKDSPAPKKRS